MAPPLQQAAQFAVNPDHRKGSQQEVEAAFANEARQRHYNRVGQLPSTQTHRDPVQDEVFRNMMNGRRKMKITTTDENGINTTVFFDEAASLELIDHMAAAMSVKETRSRKGFRASLRSNNPTTGTNANQASSGVHTENTIH